MLNYVFFYNFNYVIIEWVHAETYNVKIKLQLTGVGGHFNIYFFFKTVSCIRTDTIYIYKKHGISRLTVFFFSKGRATCREADGVFVYKKEGGIVCSF